MTGLKLFPVEKESMNLVSALPIAGDHGTDFAISTNRARNTTAASPPPVRRHQTSLTESASGSLAANDLGIQRAVVSARDSKAGKF